MKRLAIILPYDEKLIDNFTEHFKATIPESDNLYYKLVFMRQKSNRPLNKGKLFNIGYMLHKDNFDYFCFHDSDLIPISDECDYSYEEKPISLVGMRNKIEFGEHETIDNFRNFTLPYDEYFGGAILFTGQDFQEVNGYSNEYWGVGYEDWDLLLRCTLKKLPIRKEFETQISKTYGNFNGTNSYIGIDSNNVKIKNSTNKSFTMCAWFKPNGEPPYGADVDSNRCEYFIFGRPGYHMGLSYTHGGFAKCAIWVRDIGKSEKTPIVIQHQAKCDEWHHVAVSVDNSVQKISFYLNGTLVAEETYNGELVPYLAKPFYIGVGDPNINHWRNYFKGEISEVGLWSDSLKEHEILQIFDKGIVDSRGEYTTAKLPVGVWDFKGGYKDVSFDITGNGNHAKFHNVGFANKSMKSTTERYLPYRRNGAYGFISHPNEYSNLENIKRSEHPEILTNRNTFNKKISNQMMDVDRDGLSSTRFRIVNRQNYQGKHEIIEVVI